MLLAGLREKVEYVLQNRQEIKEKSKRCLDKIKKLHSPEDYEKKLRMVYSGEVSKIK